MLETDGEHGPTGDDDTGTTTRRNTPIAPTRDLIVLAGAVLLCMAFAPVFVSAPYSPRFVLLLGFLPLGIVSTAVLAWQRDRAAIAASAFVVIAIISSLLSDHVRVSLIGQMGKEASALLLVAFFGWWAIGRQMSDRGRSLLPFALLIGLGVNAVVGILQIMFPTSNSEFGVPEGGRSIGLTANATQLGALMAAGVAICGAYAVTMKSRRWLWWVVGAAGFSTAANLTGTRVALVSIFAVVAGLLFVHRAWVRVAVLSAGIAVGVLLAELPNAASSTSRATASFGRTAVWRYGLQAFLDRPVLGYGPGSFRAATQYRYSAEFVRTSASNELRIAWFDAHNVVIEYLVATGVLGVLALAAFAWFALRRARGPLLAAFVAIGITWFLQPLSVSTAPVALLSLGAAVPMLAPADERSRRPISRPAIAIAAALGALLASGYAFIDLRLDAAISGGSGESIENAARPFANDAVVADFVAQGWANAYFYDGADRSHLVKWAAEPALREPDRPYWWSKLAGTRMAFQDYEGARDALDHAIALQPWSPSAWPLMLSLADKTDDAELKALATEKVCELQLDSCPNDSGG